MAKNNQKNFITQQMQQNGEFWVAHITPDNIQRNTKRIVKEIVCNKINYESVGRFFIDSKFLDNLIIGVKNELEINTLYCDAVLYYRDNFCPQFPNITIHLNHLKVLVYVYKVILDRLYMVQESQNIGYLSDLSALLIQYRNHLS